MNILLAIILGFTFGLILQRIGAADPDKIVGMLRLNDLHLAKTILAGIGISSILLFAGIAVGMIGQSHISIKSLYVGVIVGGLIFGIGWAISGFCPGTGVVAWGTGRLDALFFIIGGLFGAGIFAKQFSAINATILFEKMLGGKVTLVNTNACDAVVSGAVAPLLAIGMGIIMIVLAVILPGINPADKKQKEK
jgi:uncharacterized membrane protein YedE/YeeE